MTPIPSKNPSLPTLHDFVEELELCLQQLDTSVGTWGKKVRAQNKLKELHDKFLSLKFNHKELFELQMKVEEAKWLLSTLEQFGIQPKKCQELIYKLQNLSLYITADSSSSQKERRNHLHTTIKTIQNDLELIGSSSDQKGETLTQLLRDFKRLHKQIKRQIRRKALSNKERETLELFRNECHKLKKVFRKEFVIQLRIEEAFVALDEINNFKPLPIGTQSLTNNVNLYINAICGKTTKQPANIYFARVQKDLKTLYREADKRIAAIHIASSKQTNKKPLPKNIIAVPKKVGSSIISRIPISLIFRRKKSRKGIEKSAKKGEADKQNKTK